MNNKEILPILYDGLASTLASTVTHIEPIKLFKRPDSSVIFCQVQLAHSHEIYVWIKNLGRKPILDLNLEAPFKYSGNAAQKPVNHLVDRQTLRKGLGVYAKRTIRDYNLTQYLYNTLGQSGAFLVPRPLFHSPEHHLIVTEHMPGERLQNKIERGARWLSSKANKSALQKDCYQAGQWLQTFQQTTQNYCPGLSAGAPPERVKNSEQIVEQALERYEALLASLADQDESFPTLSEIETTLNKNLEQMQGTKEIICSVHGDFFAGNLLENQGKITGIDFSSSTWGNASFDVGYFVFQLETLQFKWHYLQSTIDGMVDAFLDGYGFKGHNKSLWTADPSLNNVLISLCVSRCLSLSSEKTLTGLRGKYRRLQLLVFRKRLDQLIRCHRRTRGTAVRRPAAADRDRTGFVP